MIGLLFGALVLEMTLPRDGVTCTCYHPHGECVTCGCPLLAIEQEDSIPPPIPPEDDDA